MPLFVLAKTLARALDPPPGAIRLTPHLRFLAALDGISEAAHEWAGLIVYRLLGRTRELFPAPTA